MRALALLACLALVGCATDPPLPAVPADRLAPAQVLLLNCVAGAEMARGALRLAPAEVDVGLCCRRTLQGLDAQAMDFLLLRPTAHGCSAGVAAVFTISGHGDELESPTGRAGPALARCEVLP